VWTEDKTGCPDELCGPTCEIGEDTGGDRECPASGRTTSFITWGGPGPVFYDLQKGLAQGARDSIGTSMALALCVLLVATRNPWIAILACGTIACITFATIGPLVLEGWELNVFELVTLCISVGMSVDFVVHLAHATAHSSEKKVTDRVNLALDQMGGSITTGALTTFMTGMFMLMADMQFFYGFGQFLTLCMVMAWVMATFLFMPLVDLTAPLVKLFDCTHHAHEDEEEL